MNASTGPVPLTPDGYRRLKEKLDSLRQERPLVSRMIDEARQLGDLSENAEYHAAKERLELLGIEIARLEDILSRAQVVDPKQFHDSKVRFGATVTIYDEDKDEELAYTLVGEPEADIKEGRLSITSPMGRALIGKEEGEEVEFKTPSGSRRVAILKVEYR